jgi:hypothetical protein
MAAKKVSATDLGKRDGEKWAKKQKKVKLHPTMMLGVAIAAGEHHFALLEKGKASEDETAIYCKAFIDAVIAVLG